MLGTPISQILFGSFSVDLLSKMETQIFWPSPEGQYLDMQELEVAELPVVLKVSKSPIQEVLPVPHYLPELIREML